MVIRNFEEVEERARKTGPKKVSVLGAESKEFLLALKEAHRRNYAEPVLLGDGKKIRKIAEEISFDISKFVVIDSRDPLEIVEKGVHLVTTGETDFVLRGYIDSPAFYRSLISAASKRGPKGQICAVAMMQFPLLPKIIALTDTGMAVAPDAEAKMEIIKNTVDLFFHLGYESPQVGIIAARRELNDQLNSVSDAVKIREAFARGELPECRIVEGLSLSDFLFGAEGFLEDFDDIDYSRIPDILLVHNLEFGNIFGKINNIAERDFFSGVRRQGVIMGAGIPTVISSRADTHKSILTDIALGVLIS
ncbi:MAG: phosphate acyltransferase [Smithellaceae bacterium]